MALLGSLARLRARCAQARGAEERIVPAGPVDLAGGRTGRQ